MNAPVALPEPEVRPLFASPAFVTRLENAAALNAQLRETILNREALDKGLNLSNAGGWHSGLDFLQWGGPALKEVLLTAGRLAKSLTRDRKGRGANLRWQVECWANVNRRQQANKRHTHPGCFWSGTYYVDAGTEEGANPHASASNEPDGAFAFEDPRGAPQAQPRTRGAVTFWNPDQALLAPEAGKMILFPSWMPHAVRPYMGGGTRISIAFNFALDRQAPGGPS